MRGFDTKCILCLKQINEFVNGFLENEQLFIGIPYRFERQYVAKELDKADVFIFFAEYREVVSNKIFFRIFVDVLSSAESKILTLKRTIPYKYHN